MNRYSFITRICDNSADWQHPTGQASQNEASNTYSHKNGFGHEEWLFRSEWLIDGWRYAFLQGVNKSHQKLLRINEPFDVTLFTIRNRRDRRYVARIQDVECLDEQQAKDALNVFKKRGWYKKMLAEIKNAKGDISALRNTEFAKHILNVRFRLQNVIRLPPNKIKGNTDPVLKLCRYQLVDSDRLKYQARRGIDTLPKVQSHFRKDSSPRICTPEHARIQKKLMEELKAEYPNAEITRENDFVDVCVQTATELILFEIKSDLDPRMVIRQALGQLLEYAYYAKSKHNLSLQLVIVGRKPLSQQDTDYLDRLKSKFQLPLAYRVVAL